MISFIVVTYNSSVTIAACLQSIRESAAHDREIIVVDNSSSDNTLKVVESFSDVTLVSLKENIGFGGANQVGFDASQGEIAVFLNPDTAIPSDFAEKVQGFFKAHEDVGILGCLILNEDGSIERTGNTFPTFFSLLYEHSGYKYLFPKSPSYRKFIIDGWDRTTARDIDAVSGACFAMQRETLTRIGGFDASFFLYFEEYDLAQRVRRIGKRVFYEPTIRVRHVGQISTVQLPSSRRQQIYNASCRRYLLKHHGELYSALFWTAVILFNIPKHLLYFARKANRDRKI